MCDINSLVNAINSTYDDSITNEQRLKNYQVTKLFNCFC